MGSQLLLRVLSVWFLGASVLVAGERHMLLVTGAPGDEEYERQFQEAARQWEDAALAGNLNVRWIKDREQLEEGLRGATGPDTEELWIVMIGHGTFDGRAARFNLEGPDISAEELAALLEPWDRDLVVINTASASAPFLVALSGENRTIITATKSGQEVNAPHFGRYLAAAITDPAADLNKDGQISLMEAFLLASGRTEEMFVTENRIASEHALLEDNGDGKGIRADFFEGLRLVRQPGDDAEPDGLRARQIHLIRSALDQALTADQRRRRNDLEREAEKLREQKDEMEEGDYYRRAEEIFLEIARIYQQVDS